MENNRNRDLFCKCCTQWFKRKDATYLNPNGGEDKQYYLSYGMCKKCFLEVNGPRMKKIQELQTHRAEIIKPDSHIEPNGLPIDNPNIN